MTRGGLIAAAVVGLGLVALCIALVAGRPAPGGTVSPSTAIGPGLAAPSPTLRIGDEVFAVAPDAVRGIDYETRRTRLEAVRLSDDAVFALTERDPTGKVVARCQSGKTWDGLLSAISSLRVLRTFSQTDANSLWERLATDAATLRVRDTFVAEPSEFQVAVTNGDVVVRDASGVFVASLPARVLDVLAAGCH